MPPNLQTIQHPKHYTLYKPNTIFCVTLIQSSGVFQGLNFSMADYTSNQRDEIPRSAGGTHYTSYSQQEQSPLYSKLPQEIRSIIFDYVLDFDDVDYVTHDIIAGTNVAFYHQHSLLCNKTHKPLPLLCPMHGKMCSSIYLRNTTFCNGSKLKFHDCNPGSGGPGFLYVCKRLRDDLFPYTSTRASLRVGFKTDIPVCSVAAHCPLENVTQLSIVVNFPDRMKRHRHLKSSIHLVKSLNVEVLSLMKSVWKACHIESISLDITSWPPELWDYKHEGLPKVDMYSLGQLFQTLLWRLGKKVAVTILGPIPRPWAQRIQWIADAALGIQEFVMDEAADGVPQLAADVESFLDWHWLRHLHAQYFESALDLASLELIHENLPPLWATPAAPAGSSHLMRYSTLR